MAPFLLLLAALAGYYCEEDVVPKECLACLCRASSNCNLRAGCTGKACGPFNITRPYWIDAEMPTVANFDANSPSAFDRCSRNYDCAVEAVQAYIQIYKQDCNGDGNINCDDFVAIHRLGPNGCINGTLPKVFGERYRQCQSEVKLAANETEADDAQNEIDPLHISNLNGSCLNCLLTYNGGPYNISLSYWEEAGRPTVGSGAFEECAQSEKCVELAIVGYMRKWGRDCNGDGVTDCDDYAMIHFNGGRMCSDSLERNVSCSIIQ